VSGQVGRLRRLRRQRGGRRRRVVAGVAVSDEGDVANAQTLARQAGKLDIDSTKGLLDVRDNQARARQQPVHLVELAGVHGRRSGNKDYQDSQPVLSDSRHALLATKAFAHVLGKKFNMQEAS
jgi:hypothetical protein